MGKRFFPDLETLGLEKSIISKLPPDYLKKPVSTEFEPKWDMPEDLETEVRDLLDFKSWPRVG